jgi:hypothetical protein
MCNENCVQSNSVIGLSLRVAFAKQSTFLIAGFLDCFVGRKVLPPCNDIQER